MSRQLKGRGEEGEWSSALRGPPKGFLSSSRGPGEAEGGSRGTGTGLESRACHLLAE